MRKAVASLLAACTLATSAGAQLQGLSGSEQELREYVGEYARCMVRYHHGEARKLVLSNAPNDRLERDFGSIYTSKPLVLVTECDKLVIRDGFAFRLDPDIFRGALAQELVLNDLHAAETGGFSNRGALTHWVPETQASLSARLSAEASERKRQAIKKGFQQETARIWLSHYGECVVRGNAQAAFDMIVAKPGSSGEQAAIADIQPALGKCLTEGASLTFGKPVLRGALAINYYRLAMATPTTADGVVR